MSVGTGISSREQSGSKDSFHIELVAFWAWGDAWSRVVHWLSSWWLTMRHPPRWPWMASLRLWWPPSAHSRKVHHSLLLEYRLVLCSCLWQSGEKCQLLQPSPPSSLKSPSSLIQDLDGSFLYKRRNLLISNKHQHLNPQKRAGIHPTKHDNCD